MSLRIIYGRSGSGKSQFCFSEISKLIDQDKKIYIITPEQFSFTAEQRLMQSLDTDSIINAEVLTFNRMAYRVINEVGNTEKNNISKSGKAMLLSTILDKQQNNLKFLNNSKQNLDVTQQLVTELKKHNVTSNQLQEFLDESDNKYLNLKINDIKVIFDEFNNAIERKYIDPDDILTILQEKLSKSSMFDDTLIYIDEFSGYTKQEYELIKILLKKACKVSITVCTDTDEISTSPDTDIFYSNKNTLHRLIQIAKQEKIQIDAPVILKDITRFKNKELQHIESNIYTYPYSIYEKDVENVKLFLAANPYSEVEYIAGNIIKLIQKEQLRYRDISIITKDIDSYSSLIKMIFEKYNIPVFIDVKKDLSSNILIKYIISILEVLSKNWSYDTMFSYIKTGLVELDAIEISKIENYCIKWGIKGNLWYKSDWKYGIDENNQDEIEGLNILRRKIVNPILELKEQTAGKKSFLSITKTLYNFIKTNGIEKKVLQKAEELSNIGLIDIANEYMSSIKILYEVLDEIVKIFESDSTTFDRYIQILKVGIENKEFANIPSTLDSVVVGDIDRSKSHKVKVVFIIGLNDGAFPSAFKSEGYLNDSDRVILENKNIELAKTVQARLYEDQFNIYKAFTIAEEKLYLSYVASDKDGTSKRPSILINKIKKIFNNIKQESDVIIPLQNISIQSSTYEILLQKLRELMDGKDIEDVWYSVLDYYKNDSMWSEKLNKDIKGLEYSNLPQKIDSKNIENLYGNTLKTSVSRLEQYKKCPFSFYIKYALKLKPKEELKIASLDTGSFMHETIDEFFEYCNNNSLDIKSITQEQMQEIIYQLIDKKLELAKNYKFTSTAKYNVLTKRLKKVILQSLEYILYSLQNSDFDVLGSEVEFRAGKSNPPIQFNITNDKKIEITGKIDRIDIGKIDDKKYIRIIDYKSKSKSIDLNEVVNGFQIQLITYLDSVVENTDYESAGILYFNLIDPIINGANNLDDEQIKDMIKKEFKMKGLLLADVNVIRMMDKTLDSGISDIIPARLSGDKIVERNSTCVTKEDFENLQKHVKKLIKQIAKEILEGNIGINPYYNIKDDNTPCNYCEYKSICNFDPNLKDNNYNIINRKNKQDILEEIKKTNLNI